MRFETFKKKVEAAGLQARDCGNGHWQIIGGPLLVSYWDRTKHGSVYYVAGTTGRQYGWAESAIRAARTPPPLTVGRLDMDRHARREIRRAMWEKSPRCHWCGGFCKWKHSSIDHVIPLSRGGLDNANNMVLAHKRCNHDRGNRMPELQQQGESNHGNS